MVELKFYINEDYDKVNIELFEGDIATEKELIWAKKALSYAIQLNYTDLLEVNTNTIDLGASIIFSEVDEEDLYYDEDLDETYYSEGLSNEDGFQIELDLNSCKSVVGGLNCPSALAAKTVFKMLDIVNKRCLEI